MTFKYQPKNQNEIDKNIPSSFTQNDTSRILDRINLNRSTRLQSLKFRKIYGTFNEEDDSSLSSDSDFVACVGQRTYSGNKGIFSYDINLGSLTGDNVLYYEAYSVPDRFVVEYDGSTVIDTGFVGNSFFNSQLNSLGLSSVQGNGQGFATFTKSTSQPTSATVIVYALLDGTAFNFTLNCPTSAPQIFYPPVITLSADFTGTPGITGLSGLDVNGVVITGDALSGGPNINTDVLSAECKGIYTELSAASAFDTEDGVIPASAIPVGGDIVDTNTLGTYFVTYSATDSDGNVGTTSRVVKVVDTFPPIITLSGAETLSAALGVPYEEIGATALDHCDGVVPVTVDNSSVNTSVTGTYTVGYSATDVSGNLATDTRTVIVVLSSDITYPFLTLSADEFGNTTPLSAECGTTYQELCATAVDDIDGILPVVVGGDTVNTSAAVGTTFTVEYSATDFSNNTGTINRTVIIVDTLSPVVTVSGANPMNIEKDSTYQELCATAVDDCDGAVGVTIGGDTVDTSTVDTYSVVYSATDRAGNVGTSTRTVNVTGDSDESECTGQRFFAGGQGTETVEVVLGSSTGGVVVLEFETYQIPDKFVVTHNNVEVINTGFRGNSRYNNSVSGGVVGPGNGTAEFTKTSTVSSAFVTASGPLDGTAWNFTLHCPTSAPAELIPPVITLNALPGHSSPHDTDSIFLSCGESYTEPGATAVDNVDGSVPVTTGGDTVNTSVAGTYTVTYSATDSDGNVGTNSRLVTVPSDLACCLDSSGNHFAENFVNGLSASVMDDVDALSLNFRNIPGDVFDTTYGTTTPVFSVAGSSTPPGAGFKRFNSCLIGVILHVDGNGNITDKLQTGRTTNNKDLAEVVDEIGLLPGGAENAGCYAFVFEFFGWKKGKKDAARVGGSPGFVPADDKFDIYAEVLGGSMGVRDSNIQSWQRYTRLFT